MVVDNSRYSKFGGGECGFFETGPLDMIAIYKYKVLIGMSNQYSRN